MKTIDRNASTSEIRGRLIRTAQHGVFNGKEETLPYLDGCKWFIQRINAVVILTRDVGYHTSGWWKNADYERCYHVSISYPEGKNFRHTEWLLKELFGYDRRLMWCEPPYSEIGKQNEVYHYRLFCDEAWQPMKPRGEVYNTQFTERGWKSFSELHRI